ncbi:APC membrane recruitment protein 3 isoform X2 [Xenopus laevis]|uniref:APC membrane recruitment protein 3 isoform X2 n=1 Tax=Xenopus laevis TaxID=8355 RepID=A0A8J1KPZ4_XENLA|nr:APC membrane recruitment protein 3 isoform X2 [Xenopus laevis]
MELLRAKTFIKSYVQNPPENLPCIGVADKKNQNAEMNISGCNNKINGFSTREVSHRKLMKITDNNVRCNKLVKKSKTHDCVSKEERMEEIASANAKGRIPSSVSFSGFENTNGKGNCHSAANQQMIDYRNFVPQIPFVPSVAKTLPRKRISLKKPKKGFKNIFQIKRNKCQDIVSLPEKDRFKQIIFNAEEGKMDSRELYSDELSVYEFSDNELYIDTIDCYRRFCEDVASLKSFDSLTGCGEIFADENPAFLGTDEKKDGHKLKCIPKDHSMSGTFQGGVEKLASPAKSESVDFTRLCGHNKSVKCFCSNLQDGFALFPTSQSMVVKEASQYQVLESPSTDLVSSNESFTDPESPVSTSDEGYCDSTSPGMYDEKKENTTYPRDSYSRDSRDALFELFYDSNESMPCSAIDSTLSISGNSTDNPQSMYSFCVGSEENMATQTPSDLVGDFGLQSSWKGTECLMKLCDTELSLTIGMVNWLRKTGNNSEPLVNNVDSFTSDQHKHAIAAEELPSKNRINTREVCDREDQCTIKHELKSEGQLANDVFNQNETEDHDSKHKKELSGPQIEEAPLCTPDTSLLEKKSGSLVSDNQFNCKMPLLISNEGKYCNQVESYNCYFSKLDNIDSMHLLNSPNEQPPKADNQNDLQSRDLDCVASCMKPTLAENDQNIIKVLENCTNQIASLHISHKNHSYQQEKHMNKENILQSQEVSKNYIKWQKYGVQPAICPALSYRNKPKETNIETEMSQLTDCKEDSKDNHTPAPALTEHIKSQLFTKEMRTPVFLGNPRFLPYFCRNFSPLISRCSSALYKMHNSGEALIFFNSPFKPDESLGNTDEHTRDANCTSNVLGSGEMSKRTELLMPTDYVHGKIYN